MLNQKDETTVGLVRFVEDADDAIASTLKDILDQETEVPAPISSVGKSRKSKEILNYNLIVGNPRQRLSTNPKRRINLPGAVARFVWMMAANNRLKDIEFYWGAKVAPYSDDGIIVPGSSYGERMLHPRPGVNQVEGIIQRLKEDQTTRRAAISIYQAEDAIRESSDIPCAFGLFYHVRNGELHATVIMRSNNAFILLPYNMFEFSLLAEAVAAELKLPLGSLTYNALSMHIYEDNYEIAREAIGNADSVNEISIPTMPSEPSPIEQIKELVKLEAEARHAAAGFSKDNFEEWLKQGEERLNPYWQQFYFLLLLHMVSKRGIQPALDKLERVISEPWKSYLPEGSFTTKVATAIPSNDLFGTENSAVVISFQESEFYKKRLQSLEKHCDDKSQELKRDSKLPVSFSEYVRLRDSLVGGAGEPMAQAAQNLPLEISSEAFDEAFLSIREKQAE